MNNSTAAIKEYLSQAQEGSLFSINELVNYASYFHLNEFFIYSPINVGKVKKIAPSLRNFS